MYQWKIGCLCLCFAPCTYPSGSKGIWGLKEEWEKGEDTRYQGRAKIADCVSRSFQMAEIVKRRPTNEKWMTHKTNKPKRETTTKQ
jgi:hypothetical protein